MAWGPHNFHDIQLLVSTIASIIADRSLKFSRYLQSYDLVCCLRALETGENGESFAAVNALPDKELKEFWRNALKKFNSQEGAPDSNASAPHATPSALAEEIQRMGGLNLLVRGGMKETLIDGVCAALLDMQEIMAAGARYNEMTMAKHVQHVYADRVCIAVKDCLPFVPAALSILITSFVAGISGMHHLPSASDRAKELAMILINTPPDDFLNHSAPPEPFYPAPLPSVPNLNLRHSSFGKEFSSDCEGDGPEPNDRPPTEDDEPMGAAENNIHQATAANTASTDDPDSDHAAIPPRGSNDLTGDSPGTSPPQAPIHCMSRLDRRDHFNAAFLHADIAGPALAPPPFHQSISNEIAAIYAAEQNFPNPLLAPRQLPLNRFQVAKGVDTEGKHQHQQALIANITAGTNMVWHGEFGSILTHNRYWTNGAAMIPRPHSMAYKGFIRCSSSNVISDDEQRAFTSSQDRARLAMETERTVENANIRNIANKTAYGDVGRVASYPSVQARQDAFTKLSRKYEAISSANLHLKLAASAFERAVSSISVKNFSPNTRRILAHYAGARATAARAEFND
jgi:hypothetical protein